MRAPGLTRVRPGPRARHPGDAGGEERAGCGDDGVGGGGAEARAGPGTGTGTRPLTAAPHPVPLRPSGPARDSHSSRIKAGSRRGSWGQPDAAVSEPPSWARVRGRSAALGGPRGGHFSEPGVPGCAAPGGRRQDAGQTAVCLGTWTTSSGEPPAVGGGWEAVREQSSVQKWEHYRLVEALHLSLVSVLHIEIPLITH